MFNNLGRALIRLRERRGASQAATARAAGIGKSQLSKYENGKELPKLESLERVLRVLGVGYFELSWLLDVIDREAAASPAPPGHDIDELFNRLTRGIFVLHREMVKELPHG
jgi:transcriptional regulator with XRE-family HTH domain